MKENYANVGLSCGNVQRISGFRPNHNDTISTDAERVCPIKRLSTSCNASMSSSENEEDEIVQKSFMELIGTAKENKSNVYVVRQSHELLRDYFDQLKKMIAIANPVRQETYRLHWLSRIHCNELYLPCRIGGNYFPVSLMGRLLALQFMAESKPQSSYIDSFFRKCLQQSLLELVVKKVQIKYFMQFPGYSIDLNWLDSHTRLSLLSNIERVFSFQRNLEIVAFEYSRLNPVEAVKFLLGLALGNNNTLKELFVWYLFKDDTCPLIGHCFTDKELVPFMGKKLYENIFNRSRKDTGNVKSKKSEKPFEIIVTQLLVNNSSETADSDNHETALKLNDFRNIGDDKNEIGIGLDLEENAVKEEIFKSPDPCGKHLNRGIVEVNPGLSTIVLECPVVESVCKKRSPNIRMKISKKKSGEKSKSEVTRKDLALEKEKTGTCLYFEKDCRGSIENCDFEHEFVYNKKQVETNEPNEINSTFSHEGANSLETWIENFILDDTWEIIMEKGIKTDDLFGSTSVHSSKFHSSYSKSVSISTVAKVVSQLSNQTSVADSKKSLESINKEDRHKKHVTLYKKAYPKPLDREVITFEQLFTRFTGASELELLAEIRKRATLPFSEGSVSHPAKFGSVNLCHCYVSDLNESCSMCHRGTNQDLTHHDIERKEIYLEIYEFLHVQLGDENYSLLDDKTHCLQKCYEYIAKHMKSRMKKQTVRMLYTIALSAFTNLTRLSINYGYLADGTGKALICIGAIRKSKLRDLELLCTKADIPSPSSQAGASCTKHAIPNIAWKKAKLLCPQLRVHLVIFGMARYNVARSFFSKDLPLESVNISNGYRGVRAGEFKLWNFDCLLRTIGSFHDTLVSLTLYTWHTRERMDNFLLKLLKKLTLLQRFLYCGSMQFMITFDRICDFYLDNETNIIELKIFRIHDPCRSGVDMEIIRNKETFYKPKFENRGVDFAIGTFSL